MNKKENYKEFCNLFHELYLEALKIKKIVDDLEIRCNEYYNKKYIKNN